MTRGAYLVQMEVLDEQSAVYLYALPVRQTGKKILSHEGCSSSNKLMGGT